MTGPLPRGDLDALASLPVWENLRGRRIFFTGASGFFGSWLLESYLAAAQKWDLGGAAVVLTRDSVRFARSLPHLAGDPRVSCIEGDARNFRFPEGPIDLIIHSLVPEAGPGLAELEAFFSTATSHLLRLARERGCERFLLCSTGAVYQPQDPPAPFTESSERMAAGSSPSYGSIRRDVEDRCLESPIPGTIIKIARGFAFFGPRLPLDGAFAAGNFLRDALECQPIVVRGTGRDVRSYLYAADMAEWLWTFLLAKPATQICNIGSPEPMPIGGLASMIGSLSGQSVQTLDQLVPGAAPGYYVPCTRRAREEFGLSVRTPLREGLGRTLQWLRTQS